MLFLSKLNNLLIRPLCCRRWLHHHHHHQAAAANSLLHQLKNRGFVDGLFPSTSEGDICGLLDSGEPQTAYAGFDPTADSLHLGNLLVLVALLHWQRAGHRPIALVGGATGLFGDPSGRSVARTIMPQELMEANLASIKRSMERIISHHQQYFWPSSQQPLPHFEVLDNSSWYQGTAGMDLHPQLLTSFKKGTLLNRTSVRLRKESGDLKLHEFFYQCLQAYDWRHLLENYNCRFQFGGKDQLGNFHTGYHYTKRFHPDRPVYALLLPLLLTRAGEKYGKSANNAIWLEPHKTSPFLFYQFFLSQDCDLETQLKMFTFLPQQEIKELLQEHQSHPEQKLAQHGLAREVTLLVHGEHGVTAAQNCADILQSTESLGNVTEFQMGVLREQLPCRSLPLESALSLQDLAAKCYQSRLRVNLRPEKDPARLVDPSCHILPGNHSLLTLGEEKHMLIHWT